MADNKVSLVMADKPAEHDYSSKRRALYAYVRDLERWGASEVEAARASPADTRSERESAEQEFTLSSYWHATQSPVGSRDWMLFWQGWQARASLPAPTDADWRKGPMLSDQQISDCVTVPSPSTSDESKK